MMRFKLDENLSARCADPLRDSGCDVSTARDQGLGGADDSAVAEACRRERRCLLTADQDFAQILDFPPNDYAGIVVLRHPHPTLHAMLLLVQQVAAALAHESLDGSLWIVEPGRIRIHETGSGETK